MNRFVKASHGWLWVLLLCFTAPVMAQQVLDQLATTYASVSGSPAEDDMPVIIEKSSHDFDKTLENLKRAIAGNNFRIIREQQLGDGFDLPARAGSRETILYFCNFSLVNEAIHIDRRVGQFLPCRITVVEHEGQVFLMSINPRRVSKLFANEKLADVCEQISQVYKSLISEATF